MRAAQRPGLPIQSSAEKTRIWGCPEAVSERQSDSCAASPRSWPPAGAGREMRRPASVRSFVGGHVLGAALVLSGCLVPERSIPCGESSDRCEPPYVTAPFVLGKPDGDSNAYTHGLRSPTGITMIDGMLFVADTGNDRILIWKTWPTRQNQPADLVIGQKQLGLLESGPLGNSVRAPRHLSGDAKRLFVGTGNSLSGTASENNRLLMFNLPIQQNFPNVGQSLNIGQSPSGTTGRNFNQPAPLLVGDTLLVADQGFNRVLRWQGASGFSTSDANSVLGQSGLGASMVYVPATSSSITAPSGSPASDGTRLYLADSGNHRALIWDNVAMLIGTPPAADQVLGQKNFGENAKNRGGSPGLNTLSNPQSISAAPFNAKVRIAVADAGNHRVLLWDSLAMPLNEFASVVLGQVDGTGALANPSGITPSSLSAPAGVYTDGTRVAVADTGNNRLLLWNQWPTANAKPADLILGQASDTGGRENGLFASPQSFNNPTGITRVGDGLAVIDRGFFRVLLWPKLPVSPADQPTMVLGQPDFTSSAYAGGSSTPTADGLTQPASVASDGKSLLVVDGFGSRGRILLWRSLPTRPKQPADVVLLKPGFTDEVGTNMPRSDAGSLQGAALHAGRIYSVDSSLHRVLIWRSLPTQNNQPADVVLGQPNLDSGQANQGGPASAATLSAPRGIFVDDGHIYVADTGNHRVLVWNTNDPTSGQPADAVIGQPSFSETQGCMAGRLCTPQTFSASGNRIYVVENQNNRILSWGTRQPGANEPADRVFGQADLSTTSANLGRLAIDRLYAPQGIVATDRGVYISDTGNGRIVVLPPSAP